MDKGFVKVPRAVTGWKEFSDPALFYAYYALMSNMRFTETVIDGITVGVGQLLVSKTQLSELFGMSVSRTRSTLSRFERMGGIKKQNIKNKYTLITVLKPFLTGERERIARKEAAEKNTLYSRKNEETVKGCADAENKKTEAAESFGDAAAAENECELKTESCRKESNGKTDGKYFPTKENKTETENTEEIKTAFGKFSNVYLTQKEYEEFRSVTPDFRFFIDSLSARLINSPGKKYNSHYALLINNFNEENIHRKRRGEPENKPGICSSNASYDIQRAIERSYTVPKLKKREKR